MNSMVKNIILICALSAVAVMCVGLFLYDYIPSGLTVSKASQYETSTSTTEVLSGAQEAQSLLTSQNQDSSSTSGSTSDLKTNIVLKEYDVSKTDLARYQQEGDYEKGRPDPFAEVEKPDTGNETSNTVQEPGNGNTTTAPSDGTFYNTAHKK